jgi:predicted amidohydrolase YtcJ
MRKTDDTIILEMLKDGKTQKEIAEHFSVSPAAICKRVKRFLPPPDSLNELTEKEQAFALAISKGMTQTDAAMASFDVTSRVSAKSLGCNLMAKPDIQVAVADLMQQQGLTRTYRVQKLKQHVDNRDPNVSLKALDQSWKLDGAYTETHVNLKVNYADYDKTIEVLDAEIAELEERLRQHVGGLFGPVATPDETDS